MLSLLAAVLIGAVLPGPNGSYIAAAQDLEQNVPSRDWRYVRYLSLYAVPEAQRPALAAASIYWVNCLSTRRLLYKPPLVADGTLLRLDLRKLDWDAYTRRDAIDLAKKLGVTLKAEDDVWEQLVRRDVYFKGNRIIKKEIQKHIDGYWTTQWNGYYYQNIYVQPQTKKEYVDVIVRGWIEPETELKVKKATYSELPIVRADWFLRETGFASTGVRAPVKGLYDAFLLQPATFGDLEKLLGANRQLIGGRGLAYGGGVTRSGVSGFNRGIEVVPTQVGGTQKDLWRTYDVKTNLDKQSIKRQFVGNDGFSTIKFDGGEAIYDLPNGLHAFVIFNADEKLIGDVPQEIAFRKNDPMAFYDLTVYPWTCVACHTSGIKPFADEQGRLAVSGEPVGIFPLEVDKDGNPAVADVDGERRVLRNLLRLGEEYHLSGRLDPTIAADQAAYTTAVRKCNELEPEANAKGFIEAFQRYQFGLVDLATAAREMGVSEDEARGMFHRSNDADLLSLISGVPCPRDAFEKAFEDGMQSRSYPWEPKK